jgi:hypothetical protein
MKRQLALSRGECQQPLRKYEVVLKLSSVSGQGVNGRQELQAAILPRLRLFIAMGLS